MIEKRGEPRFPLTSPIRVIVPGDGGHTMDSTLIDISGTGMRFLAPELLQAENVVAIEVDSRLILAEVRYCHPRGTRFVVGARRLHEIAKDAQLADAPAVVSEMLGHLRRHLAAGDVRDSQSMAVEALEKIVERKEHPEAFPLPDPEPEPELVSPQRQPDPAPKVKLLHPENIQSDAKSVLLPRLEPELVSPQRQPERAPEAQLLHRENIQSEAKSVALPQPEPERVSPQQQPERAPEAQLLHREIIQSEGKSVALPQPEPERVSPQQQPERPPEAQLLHPENIQSEAKSVALPQLGHKPVSPKSEAEPASNLEPQRRPIAPVNAAHYAQYEDLLEAARQSLSANSKRAESDATHGASKKTRIALLLAASLIVAAVLGYSLYQRKTEAKPRVQTTAVPTPIVNTAPKPEVHHAQVRMLKPTWLSLAIDGGEPFKAGLRTNDTHPFDFSKVAVLRVTDGAAVEVTIDDKPVGPIKPGPQVVQITAQGVQLVK